MSVNGINIVQFEMKQNIDIVWIRSSALRGLTWQKTDTMLKKKQSSTYQ